MNGIFLRIFSILQRSKFLIASLIIPLLVRSVPEILAGSYPLGLDTLRYIPLIQSGWVFSLGPLGFLKSSSLFYLVAAVPNWLFNNAFSVIKILGPLLLGLLSVVMYLYARRGLNWSSKKSLLVSILVSTYFVSLRISWDLYRQTVGFILLVAALLALKSSRSPRGYVVASVLMVLTVLGHELAAVVLFIVVAYEAAKYLLKRQKRSFVCLSAEAILPGVLFLLRMYSPERSTLIVPLIHAATGPSLGLASDIFGLMLYCYVLILPFVLLGFGRLKDVFLRIWLLVCLGIPVLTLLYPSASLPYWNRWVYIMVYPLIFFAVEGFARLWHTWQNLRGTCRRLVPKVFAVVYLGLLLTMSGYYLSSTPEHPFSYFSQYNPYLMHIPSSMLQTTISAEDAPSLVGCLDWLNRTMGERSVVVTHYAVYDWVRIYLDGRVVLSTPIASLGISQQTEASYADSMVASAGKASVNGSVGVFTVWWVEGAGWYQIPSLHLDFVEVYRVGRMAVYSFSPS